MYTKLDETDQCKKGKMKEDLVMTKKNLMRRFTSLALATVMAVSFAGCGKSSSTTGTNTTPATTETTTAPAATETEKEAATDAEVETIKIGFLAPLSGASANLGQQTVWAAEMMVDIINNENPDLDIMLADTAGLPNLNGAKLELVVGDTKGDPQVAVSEAKRLISEEGIVALAGNFSSAMTKTVAVVTEQYEIPLLTAGTATTLTDGSNNLSWLFRFGLNDEVFTRDTFEYMKSINDSGKASIKTVAFISEDTEFGANIKKVEAKYAEQYGFEVVEDITYSQNATNLSSEVMKLKSANPDVVIMAAYASDAILFVKTIKEQNYQPKMLIGQRGGFIVDDFIKALGDDTEYIFSSCGWAPDINTLGNQQISKLYPEKYSNGISLNDGMVRDSINILYIALGINQAGTTESAALKEALMNLKVDPSKTIMPWEIEMNEYGQNTAVVGGIAQIQGGVYKTVFPEAAKSADGIVPVPGWNER